MNPKENVSAIMLRSGKELEEPLKKGRVNPKVGKEADQSYGHTEAEQSVEPKKVSVNDKLFGSTNLMVPFPGRLADDKKEEDTREMLKVFQKVEINIPLLDAIRQVPRYAKFLKDLCARKIKCKDNERVCVGETVSAVIQRKLPEKCKDLGMFSIPFIIGNKTESERTLFCKDMGDCVNFDLNEGCTSIYS